MGQLYIPGKRSIKGPWLLGISELESLGMVMELIEKKLAESAELQMLHEAKIRVDKGDFPSLYPDFETTIASIRKDYAEQKLGYWEKSKKITLTSSDDKTLTDSSVKDLVRDSRLKDFTPKQLNIKLKDIIQNSFALDVGRKYDGELDYAVDCYDEKCKDDIVFEIDNWVDKHRPTKPKQIWNKFGFLFVMVSFFAAVFLLPYIVTIKSYDYKPTYKNELNTLLDAGLNKNNEAKAVELYIKYNMDYLPKNVNHEKTIGIDYQWLRVASVFFLIFVASIFRPKTTIGIGQHKGLVQWYNTYTKLVFATIPGSILLPPLFVFIRKLLGL